MRPFDDMFIASEQQGNRLDVPADDGHSAVAAAPSVLPPSQLKQPAESLCENQAPPEHVQIPDEPLGATSQDAGEAAQLRLMHRLSDPRQQEHITAQQTAPATSDATTVTGDHEGVLEVAEVPATSCGGAADEGQSLEAKANPHPHNFAPPAIISPDVAPDILAISAGDIVPIVADLSHPKQASGQQDMKAEGEPTNAASRPPTTRQVACAARTILSLSRADAVSPDRVDQDTNGAATQRSRPPTETGVLPPRTPAKAKEINSLAALLAGEVAAQAASHHAQAEVAIAQGRHAGGNSSVHAPLNASGASGKPSVHAGGSCAAAVRGVHAGTGHSMPHTLEWNSPSASRIRGPCSPVMVEDCAAPAVLPGAERREHSRALFAREIAPKDSCAGEQGDHEDEFYRKAGDISGLLASLNHDVPRRPEVSHGAPARLRRSNAAHAGPSSALPEHETMNRPPQHCSSGKSDPEAWPSHATGSRYRSPHTAFDDHKQHRLDAGEEQALRPQRSHAHAVKHDGGHKDTAPEAPQHDTHGHENAHGHRMEQRNGRKRSHPHAVQPSGHGSDTAGCRDMEWGGEDWGNEGGMDDEAGEEPAHGYRDSDRHISAGTRNGAHAHMMEDVDAGSGDEPARKVGKSSRSEKYRQFSNLKGVLVYSKDMFHKCSQVVNGMKHELFEKESEVSLLKSEVKSLRSVVRLAQDMFRIIDKCDNTNYRGQFDTNVANCLGR